MLKWLFDGKKTAAERREEALSAYIDGELGTRERADLERSLAEDATLRAELAELRQVVGMMREVPRAPLPRSFTLDPAVYGRAQRPWRGLYPALRTATVLATLALIFLFAGDVLLGLSGGALAPAAEVAMETEPAQMRQAVEVTVEAERVVTEPEAAEAPLAAEAPEAELAADAAVEEAAPAEEPAAESADRMVEGEAVTATQSIEALEAPPEGEEPKMMVVPPTATPAATAEAESGAVSAPMATPAPEGTWQADGIEPPAEAPATVEEEVAPRSGEDDRDELNWLLIAEIGLGGLAVILVLVTLLARRYGW
jgi:anti-sigma factor RsiW